MTLKDEWAKKAADKLVGRTITDVRYLDGTEVEDLGWFDAPLVIFFDDGSYIFPSSDDEGNSAGSLFTSYKDLPTIPVV